MTHMVKKVKQDKNHWRLAQWTALSSKLPLVYHRRRGQQLVRQQPGDGCVCGDVVAGADEEPGDLGRVEALPPVDGTNTRGQQIISVSGGAAGIAGRLQARRLPAELAPRAGAACPLSHA